MTHEPADLLDNWAQVQRRYLTVSWSRFLKRDDR